MSEKPEALRLADWHESVRLVGVEEECWKAATELRRLHAENERLHDELRQSSIDITRAEVERLKAENERLRDGLACDWAELKACRASLREHLLEIERLRELLKEARGAKWLVVQDNLLDRIDAALRREGAT